MAGTFELYADIKGLFRFRLKAGNGEVILAGQRYKAKSSAQKGIASVQTNCADDSRFVRKQSKAGKHYFVLRAANHRVVGTSEMYESAAAMEKGLRSVGKHGTTTRVDDATL